MALRLNLNLLHSKMINAKGKVEIARENCNNDWRSDLPTLIDRFKRVCLSDEFSDVDFVFNKGLSTEVVWILFTCYKYLLFLADSCACLCSKSSIRSVWEVFCLWLRWKETPGFISKLYCVNILNDKWLDGTGTLLILILLFISILWKFWRFVTSFCFLCLFHLDLLTADAPGISQANPPSPILEIFITSIPHHSLIINPQKILLGRAPFAP